MRRITAILFMIIVSIICMNCAKKEASDQVNKPDYTENDVRNRHLKDAVENYNSGYYKAAGSSLVNARGNRLRDEDIVIMDDLDKKVVQKTANAILELESLATEGNLHDYDVKYRLIHTNYDISSYRQKIDALNIKFLARVKKENDTYLEKYNACIEELKNLTTPTLENHNKVFVSKTSPLKLKIMINHFDVPQFYFQFSPSQLESILETLKFSNNNASIFFDKKDLVINEYNLSASKIISFNLLDSNSRIDLAMLKQLLDGDKINIDLKWFYEPERVIVSSKTVKNLKNVLISTEKLLAEYNAIKDSLYIPQNVK